MRDGDDSDDLTGESMVRLRNGHRFLWVALVTTVLTLVGAVIDRSGFFALLWIPAILTGLSGISDVARGLNSNLAVKYLSMVFALMPLLNLLPLVYYLGRAQTALKEAGDAGAARDRAQVANRSRQRAAPREPDGAAARAPARPRTAPPQVQSGSGPARTGSEIRRAVAYVKLVGLNPRSEGSPPPAEGVQLRVDVAEPGVGLPEKAQPVVRATQGMFGVFYMVDKGDYFTFVNNDELEAAGITLDELHLIGLANLLALANGKPGLTVKPQGKYHGLLMGGNFEASLLLLDELWDGPLKAYTPNGPVATVPARDICAFCDSRSAEGMAELRRVAERVTKGGDHLLGEMLLVRKQGRWREVEDEKPPDLPPIEFTN